MAERETLRFSGKVGAAGDAGQLVCDAGVGWDRSDVFFLVLPQCNGGFKLLWMRLCVCVRSYRVFWNLWLLIAVERLHDCCHVLLSCSVSMCVHT